MTDTVRLTGTIRCTPHEAEALLVAVAEHVAQTRAEPGCLAFDISGTDDPCVFEVAERFRDEAAFKTHQVRSRASAWWSITSHMTRNFEIARG